MNKTVLWVLAVIIVAGGWYLFSSSGTQTPSDASNATEQGAVSANPGVPDTVDPSKLNDTSNTGSGATPAVVPAQVITYTDAGKNVNPTTGAVTKPVLDTEYRVRLLKTF